MSALEREWFADDVGMRFPDFEAEKENELPHEQAPVYLDLDSVIEAAERRGFPVDREQTRRAWADLHN